MRKLRAGELDLSAQPIGDPPEYLPEAGKDEWRRLAEHAEYGLVLNETHRSALAEYCVLTARMVDDAMGVKAMTASERQTLNSLRQHFGLTPASQSKVKAPSAAKPENKWASVNR